MIYKPILSWQGMALMALFFVASVTYSVTPFELPWMNSDQPGVVYRSTDYPDAVFVIEAYFLSCPYCNENAPNVNALKDKYKDNDRVQVLDVGVDSIDASYQKWIERHHPNHPVLKDPRGQKLVVNQLGTVGYPSVYILDCKGKVVVSTDGVWNMEKKTLLDLAIKKLLMRKCTIDTDDSDITYLENMFSPLLQ